MEYKRINEFEQREAKNFILLENKDEVSSYKSGS